MNAQPSSKEAAVQSSDRLTLAVTSLPGLVGLSLGTVYALGAVGTIGELRGGNVSVPALFPAIPLEQILARGILLSLTYLLVTVLTAAVAFIVEVGFLKRSRPAWILDFHQRMAAHGKAALVFFYVALVAVFMGNCALLLVALLKGPWLVWALVPVTLAWFYVLGGWLRRKLGKARGLALTVLGLVLVVGGVSTIIIPQPLSHAALKLKSGSLVKGDLVAQAGSDWYISTNSGVRVIPDRMVEQAIVRPREKPHENRTLIDVLTSIFSP